MTDYGPKCPCKVGDWIRFRRDGRFVIGLVEYIKKCNTANDDMLWDIETDAGSVSNGYVLEVRSK